ncbi:MAG: NUDIX hydrolase [Candidatus Woesearchaeota archaeon]|jgi:8-oxo-dGTP diphosphatase
MEKQKPRITAAILLEHEGKFLLGKRNKINAKDFWIIPGGGVEYGEKIEDAAIREFKEETNLDVEITRFIGFKEIINLPKNYHSVIFFFLAKPKHLELNISDELSEAEVFPPEKMQELNLIDSAIWALKETGILK